MTRGIPHGPGVKCIVVGLQGGWIKNDNGRIVRIIKLRRVSLTKGNIWIIEPADDGGPLHGYRYRGGGLVPTRPMRLAAAQKYLIPIGPDEQATWAQAEDELFVLA